MTTEELELTRLMKADARVWRERAAGLDSCEADPEPHEILRAHARQRVHHHRRPEAS